MNDFDKQKGAVMAALSDTIKSAANDFNKGEERCGESMFTNAVAYLAILFAFSNYVKVSSNGCGWCIVVSAVALSLSLLFRLVDFVLSRNMYRRYLRTSKKMFARIRNVGNEQSLYEADSATADLLNDEKEFVSSSVPIFLQMMSLIVGIIFSVIALVVAML